MSRTVKFLVLVAIVVVLWKAVFADSTETIEYEPDA